MLPCALLWALATTPITFVANAIPAPEFVTVQPSTVHPTGYPSTTSDAAEIAFTEQEGPPLPPTLPDLFTQLAKAIDDWRNLGAIAGLIALINLLITLLRFGPIDEWFTVNRWKWTKPYIAAALGAFLGGLSAYQTGASVPNSIVAGILAGMAAVGWHETATKRHSENRQS